jgi:hypothetical protein
MYLKLSFYFFVLIFLLACNKEESKEQVERTEGEHAQNTIENKKSKGDTLELSANELQIYLPTSFDDYNPIGKPMLEQKKEGDNSWTIVKQVYKNQSSEISITLADYNRAYGLYAGATAIITPDYSVDSKEEKAEVVTLANRHKALVSFIKPSKTSSLIMGLGDRFLITIEGTNQENADYLAKVVDKINLGKLEEY